MITNMISSLNKKLQAVKIGNRSRRTKKTATAYVYRDDLSKRKQPPSPSSTPPPEIKKVKKRVRFADTEPIIISIDREEEYAEEKLVRIKVKLTKEEANRMLSRCSDGGILKFGDVAFELMQIPAARVCSVPN